MFDLLSKTWLLRDLSADEATLLAQFAEKKVCQSGLRILQKGQKNDFLWIIRKGEVEVLVEVKPHEEKVLATLGSGDIFGEMSWLDGGPASSTLRAIRDVEAYRIPFKNLDKFLWDLPDVHINILRKFAINLSHRLRK